MTSAEREREQQATAGNSQAGCSAAENEVETKTRPKLSDEHLMKHYIF